ncbi:class I SAM-dependent methyltransferase [Thiohalomonas denitrificans]|uniref:class I SAM-dependent methyltransferase n=1 Tax=Thiohalomonas denitrificans TaxID=415747 RepID=UPI0026EC07CA|nr:class I SAM-dependent methyltransferase [Thiohalomonas denitrificans]
MTKVVEALNKTGTVLRYLVTNPEIVRRMLSHLYKGFFVESGWINAFLEGRPVDRENNPLPWFTYPAIDFLDERLNLDMSVFEYGGGNSTLYFASRVKKVTTVEHHAEWFRHLKTSAPDNAEIIFCELEYGGKYQKMAPTRQERFDVVVVDGRDRVNCAHAAIEALSERGVIVFDDFERERYQAAADNLAENGFRQLNFWGFKPGFFERKNTAVFYRTKNVFRL